jgi:hypothetical protein
MLALLFARVIEMEDEKEVLSEDSSTLGEYLLENETSSFTRTA